MKTFKKVLSCFCAMLITAVCQQAQFTYAADTEEPATEALVWDGTYDTGWYDEEELEYHITTAAEFAGISSLSLNSHLTFEGKKIYLDTDIDFGEKSPGTIKEFQGLLDGCNHSIENINCGLIDVLYGEVRNVKIINAHYDHYINFHGSFTINVRSAYPNSTTTNEASTDGNLGIICNTLYGTVCNSAILNARIRQIDHPEVSYRLDSTSVDRYIEHQVVNRWLMIRNDMNIGGICGEAQSGRIENCISDLTIERINDRPQQQVIAGQARYNKRLVDITVNETNTIFDLPWHSVGGIAGTIKNSIVVGCQTDKIRCYNDFYVTTYSSADQVPANPSYVRALARVGGICGECLNSSILHCSVKNEGEDITKSDTCWRLTGGIVADADNSNLSCNVYTGKPVTSFKELPAGFSRWDYRPQYDTTRTGGICGTASDCKLSYCYTNYDNDSFMLESDGGIIGTGNNNMLISVYNTGWSLNGVIGYGTNDLKQCYYLSASSPADGNDGESKAISKNEANMKKKEFAERLGYPFVYEEGEYPKLAWELGETIVYGDVNTNESVDIADAVLLVKALLAESSLDSKAAYLADLDFNGKINAADLTLLKRMLLAQN